MRFIYLIISFVLFFSTAYAGTLDERAIKASNAFVMQDNLNGIIVQSSDKNDIGKNFTFIGLFGNQPKILFESGMTYTFKKRFENERTLTLVLAGESKSGGIDSFVIDKKTGKFSRVSAGLISIAGVYSVASLGVCK
jgi:hypothetical protein